MLKCFITKLWLPCMAWGWGSVYGPVSGSSVTSGPAAWSLWWWGGGRASCRCPTPACTSTPPCAASRTPACSPQTGGGTAPAFPPTSEWTFCQRHNFATYLYNRLACGGSSPGLWSRSMRACPSLLYNLNASFCPGIVILCTSWLSLIFGLSFTETSLKTQPSAGCLWQVTRWVPRAASYIWI